MTVFAASLSACQTSSRIPASEAMTASLPQENLCTQNGFKLSRKGLIYCIMPT
ncbi:hypothetical protein CEV32_4916 [Brucella rhizosphaerae]|uniref:Uncharacterized protein n=1 Tax=Brucella rhizosphaerae TaxID=571254 RepID=A0A256FXY7_9HYPH|nr:hypothetical protein CEV32_4916 [Brucella rhizosphaerae]